MSLMTARPAHWQDRKRYGWLLSGLLPGMAWMNLWQYQSTGKVMFLWLMPAVIYSLVPLLDWWLAEDRANPPAEAVPALEADRWYLAVLLLFIPLQFGLTLHAAWIATREPAGPLGAMGLLGLVLTVGGMNGVAINTAHELGHKRARWERWLSRLVLAPVAYGHFYVEHNRGHHRRVATFEDPASARLGEGYWAFLPRTLIGGLRSAWALEAERLARRGLPAWHWRHECLQAWTMTLTLYGGLVAWLGWGALPFLLAQALYGASLLEVVNYIEHYGLLRATGADGRPVRCAPEHSWNSNHRVSNLFLYHLQRHSDHHAHPARRYQALRHFDSAPQLPSGYAGLLLLAYCPPLWFRLMDRRVLAHYGGDLSRANVQPSRRAVLQRRLDAVQNR
ncbi:MAG: alkane 1-monooxygenase [Roseateles sp.]|uniref:alkane 1-monooxygenase n=1 Tax=Roseateles sp. TaxID=1971397 RepID=UPI004036B38A